MKEIIKKFETELNKIKPKTAENKKAIDSIVDLIESKYNIAVDRSKQGSFISLEDMRLIADVLTQIKIDMITHIHVLDQSSIYSDNILVSGVLDQYRDAWRKQRNDATA